MDKSYGTHQLQLSESAQAIKSALSTVLSDLIGTYQYSGFTLPSIWIQGKPVPNYYEKSGLEIIISDDPEPDAAYIMDGVDISEMYRVDLIQRTVGDQRFLSEAIRRIMRTYIVKTKPLLLPQTETDSGTEFARGVVTIWKPPTAYSHLVT